MLNNSTNNQLGILSKIQNFDNNKTMQFIEKNKNVNTYSMKKMRETAQEFESLLVYEMFKSMNKNISFDDKNNSSEENTFIKKNQTEKVFTDFLTYEKSKNSISSGNFTLGLAKIIVEQYRNN